MGPVLPDSPLLELFGHAQSLAVLTGAGCSTGSGLPEYRDRNGDWKHARPVMHQDFVNSAEVRRRYWARSTLGWPRFAAARPNTAHTTLAELQRCSHVSCIITQNVDGLHQKAGSTYVIDLHGRLSQVVCLSCGNVTSRQALQHALTQLNPGLTADEAPPKPDGDMEISPEVVRGFSLVGCELCGGTLKPDVVFFGDSVPRPRVDEAMHQLEAADGLLIVGSSLMVYSGYRFVRAAKARGMPIAIINQGKTRADAEVDLKLDAPCESALANYLTAVS